MKLDTARGIAAAMSEATGIPTCIKGILSDEGTAKSAGVRQKDGSEGIEVYDTEIVFWRHGVPSFVLELQPLQ